MLNNVGQLKSLADYARLIIVTRARVDGVHEYETSSGISTVKEVVFAGDSRVLDWENSLYRSTHVKAGRVTRTVFMLPINKGATCIDQSSIRTHISLRIGRTSKDYDGPGFSVGYLSSVSSVRPGLYFMDGKCLSGIGFSQEEPQD